MSWILEQRMASGLAESADFQLLDRLERLEAVLQSKNTPDPDEVARSSQVAKQTLAVWIDQVYHAQMASGWDAGQLGELVAGAAGHGESYETWESTAQLYLAAVAARVAWPGGPSGPANLVASQLRSGLGYPDHRSISRFARSDRGERLRRREAARLTVELAAWLGTVSPPDLKPQELETWNLESERAELQELIDRVNRAYAEARKRRPDQVQKNEQVQKNDQEMKPKQDPVPNPNVRPLKHVNSCSKSSANDAPNNKTIRSVDD